MDKYRLYFMSSDGSHIENFEPIKARDDAEAIETAKRHICRQPLELWWRERRVHTFDPRSR